MIRFNLKPFLDREGITNANQLAKFARLGYPTARRLMLEDRQPLDRIETVTLEALAAAFKVKPFALLEYTK